MSKGYVDYFGFSFFPFYGALKNDQFSITTGSNLSLFKIIDVSGKRIIDLLTVNFRNMVNDGDGQYQIKILVDDDSFYLSPVYGYGIKPLQQQEDSIFILDELTFERTRCVVHTAHQISCLNSIKVYVNVVFIGNQTQINTQLVYYDLIS